MIEGPGSGIWLYGENITASGRLLMQGTTAYCAPNTVLQYLTLSSWALLIV